MSASKSTTILSHFALGNRSSVLVLALARREPRHPAVGIGHYPRRRRQRRGIDSLTPLIGAFGAGCRNNGHPHQQRNRPICKTESVAASRAYTPISIATPAAMKAPPVKYAQNTCHGSQPGTILAVVWDRGSGPRQTGSSPSVEHRAVRDPDSPGRKRPASCPRQWQTRHTAPTQPPSSPGSRRPLPTRYPNPAQQRPRALETAPTKG